MLGLDIIGALSMRRPPRATQHGTPKINAAKQRMKSSVNKLKTVVAQAKKLASKISKRDPQYATRLRSFVNRAEAKLSTVVLGLTPLQQSLQAQMAPSTGDLTYSGPIIDDPSRIEAIIADIDNLTYDGNGLVSGYTPGYTPQDTGGAAPGSPAGTPVSAPPVVPSTTPTTAPMQQDTGYGDGGGGGYGDGGGGGGGYGGGYGGDSDDGGDGGGGTDDGGGDDGSGQDMDTAPDDGSDESGDDADQVTGLRGLNLIGASPSIFVGADVGVNINAANRAVRGAKPLSQALARKFVDLATKALLAANMVDTQPGSTARRNGIIEKLESMISTMEAHPHLDPLPEVGAQNAPAEMIRNTVLQAISEFNATAEEEATLADARARFFSDIIDNAKQLVRNVGAVASGVMTTLKWIGIGVAVVFVGGVGYLFYDRTHVRRAHA